MSMIQLTVQLATQNPQDVDPETLVFLVILTSGPKKLVISSHASSIFHLDEILRRNYPTEMANVPDVKKYFTMHSSNKLVKSLKNLWVKKNKTQPVANNIQDLLDKLASYFQLLLTSNTIAQSNEFRGFMKVDYNTTTAEPQHTTLSQNILHQTKSTFDRPMKTNQKTHLDSFEIIKVLGKGSMGKVMLVREKSSGKLFALKSIHKNWVVKHREIEHTISERNILVKIREMNHPFLMKLHQSFQTDTELFLVIDYYPGGDLATQLARFYKFDEERARFYAAEMILGIKELHRNGVVYRDLKPENVLLANTGHLVLTDFGLSKMFRDESKTTTFCGTAEYLAPEILTSLAYDYKVDLWSFGTLLYEMLVGITPFWADNQSVMYQRVLSANLEFPEDISQDAKDLISKLLVRGAHNRLDCDGVQNHPFFKGVNWDDVYSLKLKPPYVPSIKNECDLSNFDDNFTMMLPGVTPSAHVLSPSMQKNFFGFSYSENNMKTTPTNENNDSVSSKSKDSPAPMNGDSDTIMSAF